MTSSSDGPFRLTPSAAARRRFEEGPPYLLMRIGQWRTAEQMRAIEQAAADAEVDADEMHD